MPPKFVQPCVPRFSPKPPSGDGWEHEAKLDGYRIQIVKDGDNVRLFTKRGIDETKRSEALAVAQRNIACTSCVLDGELCFPNADGVPNIRDLYANFTRWRAHLLEIFVFDLLYLDGHDLRDHPLIERRRQLKGLMKRTTVPCLHLVASFEDGQQLLAVAEEKGLEGIVSKRKDAPYRSGPCRDWLKVKTMSWRASNSDRRAMFQQK